MTSFLLTCGQKVTYWLLGPLIPGKTLHLDLVLKWKLPEADSESGLSSGLCGRRSQEISVGQKVACTSHYQVGYQRGLWKLGQNTTWSVTLQGEGTDLSARRQGPPLNGWAVPEHSGLLCEPWLQRKPQAPPPKESVRACWWATASGTGVVGKK